MDNSKQLTLGQKLVGLNFNPSNNQEVQDIKLASANLLDVINALPYRELSEDQDVTSHWISLANDLVIQAQMLAVKAATWNK